MDTDADRLRTLHQFRASRFDLSEHRDDFSRGWTSAIDHAIALLFPLPKPRYSCSFPVDHVCRGLRELATFDVSDAVPIALGDIDTCPCTIPGCTGCAPGGFEIGGRR